MNLARYLSGCLKALGPGEGWETDFDLSRTGFKLSFLAPVLSLPCYFICAQAIRRQEAITLGENQVQAVPATAFILIFALYMASFVVSAYILTLVFDRQNRFRAWVILRHWAVFFTALLSGFLLGLNLIGILPFTIAAYAVMGLYLLTLAIDIRLAMRIVGFEWGAAVLTGCIITAMGLMILLMGIAQFIT